MRLTLAALLLLSSAVAAAQEDTDEPTPVEPPPIIYVPVAPRPEPILVPAAPPPKKRGDGGVMVRLDVGAAYRYAFKDSFGGAALHLLAGGEKGTLGFAGVFDLEMGASQAGLFFTTLDWGFEFFGRIGERLRLGIGPHFGLMIIQRATNDDPGQDLVGFLCGVTLDPSIDLVKFKKGGALLLYGRIGYQFVDTGRLYSYASGLDAQLGVGLRL